MAINYTKIGWDTSKYVNPTNMNQMDNGIKAACDGVDDINSKYLPKTGGTIFNSNSAFPLVIKAAAASSFLEFQNNSGSLLGRIGIYGTTGMPTFVDAQSNVKEIALKEDFGPFNSSSILRFNTILYRNAAGARVFNYTVPTTKTPTIVAILDEGSDTDIKSNFTISNSAGTIYLYTWSNAYDGHVLHITFKCE